MNESDGIIIRMTKLSDTSLIVHWFTVDDGIIKTVAKGARAAKSAFAGQLDLFSSATIIWSPARNGELHGLREVQVQQRRRDLARSYRCTLMAAYFCQLLESVTEPESTVPELHKLLTKALDYLTTGEPEDRVLLRFEKALAMELGLYSEKTSPIRAIEDHTGSRCPKARQELLERSA